MYFLTADSSYSSPVSTFRYNEPTSQKCSYGKTISKAATTTVAGFFTLISPTVTFSHDALHEVEAHHINSSPTKLGAEYITYTRQAEAVALLPLNSKESYWLLNAEKGAWAQASMDRILELSRKPLGWKGEGSTPPSQAIVNDSFSMLQKIIAEGFMAPPMISAEEEGDLVFFWRGENLLLSFSFDGTGGYSVFAEKNGQAYLEDDRMIYDHLPDLVLEVLSSLDGRQA